MHVQFYISIGESGSRLDITGRADIQKKCYFSWTLAYTGWTLGGGIPKHSLVASSSIQL